MSKAGLYNRFASFVRHHQLVEEHDRIFLAVSGGMDSIVLLHLFSRLQQDSKMELAVAHFNHLLRGEEADSDELFVKKQAQALQLPFFSASADVASYSLEHKKGIEAAARKLRYGFLTSILNGQGYNKIATGHNADDQSETILDRLLRGSGLRGLAAMRPRRGALIRPLLFARRQEIEQFALENQLLFHEDSTNKETLYRRNRIRHRILPQLVSEAGRHVPEKLNQLAEIAAEAEDYLQHEAKQAFSQCVRQMDHYKIVLEINLFLAYFAVLQKYILQMAVQKLNGAEPLKDFIIWQKLLDFIKKQSNGSQFLYNAQLRFYIDHDTLIAYKYQAIRKTVPVETIPCSCPLWQGYFFEIKEESKPLEQVLQNPDVMVQWIDADKLSGSLFFRAPVHGDRFQPLGMPGTKKLSDFFIDSKIPAYLRPSIPLLCCQSGIVWVGGYRISERFKVDASSKKLYKLQLGKN